MEQEVEKMLEDKEFLTEILNKETKEEIMKSFKDRGIIVTDEDLQNIKCIVTKSLEKGEVISENELDEVVGGARGKKKNKHDNITIIINNENTSTSSASSVASNKVTPPPASPTRTYPKQSRPATAGETLLMGGMITLIGVALSAQAISTRIKKGSWLATV